MRDVGFQPTPPTVHLILIDDANERRPRRHSRTAE
jgi:hypothetical protein